MNIKNFKGGFYEKQKSVSGGSVQPGASIHNGDY
jgi:hypothetical protein